MSTNPVDFMAHYNVWDERQTSLREMLPLPQFYAASTPSRKIRASDIQEDASIKKYDKTEKVQAAIRNSGQGNRGIYKYSKR